MRAGAKSAAGIEGALTVFAKFEGLLKSHEDLRRIPLDFGSK
jgi:hypothetical protein